MLSFPSLPVLEICETEDIVHHAMLSLGIIAGEDLNRAIREEKRRREEREAARRWTTRLLALSFLLPSLDHHCPFY